MSSGMGSCGWLPSLGAKLGLVSACTSSFSLAPGFAAFSTATCHAGRVISSDEHVHAQTHSNLTNLLAEY